MPGIAGWVEIWSGEGEGGGGWCGRRKHQVVSHREALLLLGGYAVHGENAVSVNLNDVWRSEDGRRWEQLLARAPWGGRDGHSAVVHNGHVYLMGGTQDPLNNYNDVWRSPNGRDWTVICRQAAWQGRWQHAAVSHGGSLYVLGGWAGDAGYLNDVWRSTDGMRWIRCCAAAPWRRRMFHTVISVRGAMYLMGGSDGRTKLNDVWASQDGKEWTPVAQAAQWSPRAGHAAAAFEGNMYVFGGEDATRGRLDDAWVSSDGAHWERQLAPRSFGGRQGHAVVAHKESLYSLGGVSDGVYLADCHRSIDEEEVAALARRALAAADAAANIVPPLPESYGPLQLQVEAVSSAYEDAREFNPPSPPSALGDWMETAAIAPAGSATGGSGPPSRGGYGGGYNGYEAGNSGSGRRSRGGGITVSMAAVVERLSQLERQRMLLSAERRNNLSLLAMVEASVHGLAAVEAAAAADAVAQKASGGPAAPAAGAGTAPAANTAPREANGGEHLVLRPLTVPVAADDGSIWPADALADAGGLEALRVSVGSERVEIEALQRRLRMRTRRPTSSAGAAAAGGAGGGDGNEEGAAAAEVTELVRLRTTAAVKALPRALALLRVQSRLAARQDLREASVLAGMAALEREAQERGGTVWEDMRTSRSQHAHETGNESVAATAAAAAAAVPAARRAMAATQVEAGGQHNGALAGAAAAARASGGGGGSGGGSRRINALNSPPPSRTPPRVAAQQPRRRASALTAASAEGSVRESFPRSGAVSTAAVGDSWEDGNGDAAARFRGLAQQVKMESGGGIISRAGEGAAAVAMLKRQLAAHAAACSRLHDWVASCWSRVEEGENNAEAQDTVAEMAAAVAAAAGDEGGRVSEVAAAVVGAVDPMQQAWEVDSGEAELSRVRMDAHRAVDAELLQVPAALEQARQLGDRLVLWGHDWLAQALSEVRLGTGELSLGAADLGRWVQRLERLADAEKLASECDAAVSRLDTLRELQLDAEDRVVDTRGTLEKRRRRGGSAGELAALAAEAAAADAAARNSRRDRRKAVSELAAFAWETAPELARRCPELLSPLHPALGAAGAAGGEASAAGVSLRRVSLPLRLLSEYEDVRPLLPASSGGGGGGAAGGVAGGGAAGGGGGGGGNNRHRMLEARFDDEHVVLKGYALVSDHQRRNLERELRILSRVRHDAVLRASAVVEDPGSTSPVPMLYIEFPFCSGGSLRDWLLAVAPATRAPWELQGAFRQVLCGAAHLHDRGIVHKDIKPGNILVHGDGRVLLADFDISSDVGGGGGGGGSERQLSDVSAAGGNGGNDLAPLSLAATASTTTIRAGTAGFMAPEVEAGLAATLASDIYSLGAVLFWMHFPDHPTGPLAGSDGGVGIPEAAAAAEPALAALLRRLLAADPAARPSAADALMDPYFRASGVERLVEDGALVQQDAKLEALRGLFQAVRREATAAAPGGTGGGGVRWTVRRSPRLLVPAVVAAVGALDGAEMRRPLRVVFEGEAGVDEGGMLSEMFTLFFEAVLAPRFGLFETCSGNGGGGGSGGERTFSHGVPSPKVVGSPGQASVGPLSPVAWDTNEDPWERIAALAGSGANGSGGSGSGSGSGASGSALPAEDGDDSFGEQLAMVERVTAAPGGRAYLPVARKRYSDAQLRAYAAVGRAAAKCLYEGRRLGSRLAASLFKFIAGATPTLADLREFDEQAAAGLQWLLANPGVRGMGFHFEDVGFSDKGPVTDASKAEFVRLKVQNILVESRRPALEAFREGFAGGLAHISPAATPFLRLLSHADWRVLLSGQLHVSGAQVVAVLRWYNFPTRSQVPAWLRALVLSMPEDTLRRFLVFACGSPSLPAAAVGRVEITVRCQPRSAALPVAHTCFFQLDVPDYDKEAVLRHKLLQAMTNTTTFDVV